MRVLHQCGGHLPHTIGGVEVPSALRRPDMAVEMGRTARKRAQDGFDFASFVAAHERAFERAQSIRAAASAIHVGLP